ncbi:unnamed protein product [Brassica rapa]|uniref:Uncharacterized protein n=1 Tax=Brassica campestris TaxID=3711 RepID=A0A3P5ZQG1_BRACM|nr:unnamed protein product [Brassica rapa]VDC74540.1 unnamed protein product [Brassica rapa]
MKGIGATCTSVSGKAEHRRRHKKKADDGASNFSPLRQRKRKTVLADLELLSSASPVKLSDAAAAAAHLAGFDGEDNTMRLRRLHLVYKEKTKKREELKVRNKMEEKSFTYSTRGEKMR